jgi:hypothetical protein
MMPLPTRAGAAALLLSAQHALLYAGLAAACGVPADECADPIPPRPLPVASMGA